MTILQFPRYHEAVQPISEYGTTEESVIGKSSKTQTKLSIVKLYFDTLQSFTSEAKLRTRLFRTYTSLGFLERSQIKYIVKKFTKEINCKRQSKNTFPMHQVFLCKCGWLLYNPSTLPCGHTMCKHCADENMFCIYCGYTFEDLSTPNLFIVQLLTLWFPKKYESVGHKQDARTLYKSEDYELALNEIDISISLSDEDFSAYQIRSEIYLKLKEYKKALRDANKSCALNKQCGKSQFIRGNCFSFLGKINQAIDAFQLSLELEPEDMALHSMVINRLDVILSLPDTGSKLSDDEQSSDDESPQKNVCMTSDDARGSSGKDQAESTPCNIQSSSSCSENKKDQLSLSSNTDCQKTENLEQCLTFKDDEKHSGICATENEKDSEKIHGVAKSLVKDEDFECKLCYELLFKPITTTCGHVFCKNCLLRSLDHNIACPICRLPLNDFLKNPLKPVTNILEDILNLFFNKEFNERKQIYNERMERLSRVGEDEDVEIPIFVCSIAFPYVKCPLHIFEPRYRLMIRECIESGSRKFGMCVPQGGDDYSEIGTICKISKIQNLPDGRYIITATAGQRFLVREKHTTDTMHYAKVKYFSDEPEDLSSGAFTTNARSIYDGLSQYISALNETEQDCIFNALGRLPSYDGDYERYQHGAPWVWWGLAALPLNFQAKLVLLRSKCVSERMLSLQRFLRFLTRMRTPQNAGQSAPHPSGS